MREKNFDRYANTTDSRVPIQGKYVRDVRDLAKASFRIAFRSVKLNRNEWRFDVHVVDADAQVVTEFMQEFPMCHVENTFSGLAAASNNKKAKAHA